MASIFQIIIITNDTECIRKNIIFFYLRNRVLTLLSIAPFFFQEQQFLRLFSFRQSCARKIKFRVTSGMVNQLMKSFSVFMIRNAKMTIGDIVTAFTSLVGKSEFKQNFCSQEKALDALLVIRPHKRSL